MPATCAIKNYLSESGKEIDSDVKQLFKLPKNEVIFFLNYYSLSKFVIID